MGFSRQEYWSGLPFPPPGDLPGPGITPVSLPSAALAGRFLTTSAPWEPLPSYPSSELSLSIWAATVICHKPGGLETTEISFFPTERVGKSQIKVPADLISDEGLLCGS